MDNFLAQALIYLVAALVFVPIMKRAGLGSVLGYLLAGVVIGPSMLNLVGSDEKVMHFAEFGVVIMLFIIGLELEASKLWRLRGPILGLGGLQVLITAAVVGVILLGFSIEWKPAVALGCIFALSSTAIALQSLEEKGLMKTESGQSSFAVLLFQDLAVIPMLSLFPLLSSVERQELVHHDVSTYDGIFQTLLIVGTVALIIVAGKYLARPVFRAIASVRMREIFTVCALAIVIGIAVAMHAVGMSPALGTFLAGVVLAGSEFKHELEATIEPFKGLLLGLFFIAIGAGIDFQLIAEHPMMIVSAVVGLILLKMLVLCLLGYFFKISLPQNLQFAFLLSQAGEFGFVLLAFASSEKIFSPQVADGATAVVALSMLATPLLLVVNELFVQPRFASSSDEEREADTDIEEGEVIIAGYGRFGQIVSRLLRANGVSTTLLDHNSKQIELVQRFGIKVFYGDATRMDLLIAAGIEKASMLVIAIDDRDKSISLAEEVRRGYPELPILSRAVDRGHAFDLKALGVKHVYRETFQSALDMGVQAMKVMGFRSRQAYRHGLLFKEHDERSIDELATLYKEHGTEGKFVEEARRRADDIQKIIEADRADREEITSDQAFDGPPRGARVS